MQPASLQALNSSWCSTLANTFNTNQRKLVTKTSTEIDGPRSKVWQQVSFCSSQLCLRWKKTEKHKLQISMYGVCWTWDYTFKKMCPTRITDHVSFSSCYVLLLKKNARFYDLVTSRAFHQDAILTHTAALALQAPDIYQRSETSLPPSLRVISRAKAYPGPSSKHLVKWDKRLAIKRSTHFHMFEKVDYPAG